MGDWEELLSPYKQAVDELKVKLKDMRRQFLLQSSYSPIEFVTGRVKPIASILDKAKQKGFHLIRLKRKCKILQDFE